MDEGSRFIDCFMNKNGINEEKRKQILKPILLKILATNFDEENTILIRLFQH